MTGVSTEYAAGFFDGEGSISIEGSKRERWRLGVRISQDNPSPLYELQKIWGGSISPRELRENGKRSHQWCLHTRQALKFLNDIYPFTIIKREAINIAIEFAKNMGKYIGMNGMPVEEKERRQALKEQLQSIQRWGNREKI